MARLVPFLVSSFGAHLVVLALFQGFPFLSVVPAPPSIYQVSAVSRPRPAARSIPRVSLPRQDEAPDAEPPRARPATFRRAEPRREPPPVRNEPSTPEAAPEPREALRDSSVAPAVSAETAHFAAVGFLAPVGATVIGQDGITHRAIAVGGGDSSSTRQGPSSDPCPEARATIVRRMTASTPYPTWAREIGLEGRLVLSLRIGRDGRPRGVSLVDSSGHDGLDRYVMSAVRGLGDLPRGCERPLTIPVTVRRR